MPGKAEKRLPPIKGSDVMEGRAPGQARPSSWSRRSWKWHGSPKLMGGGAFGWALGSWFLSQRETVLVFTPAATSHPGREPHSGEGGGLQRRVVLWAPQ